MDLTALVSGASALGILLNEEAIQRFRDYADLLQQWSQRFNLTSIQDPEAIQIRLFLDSLTCLQGAPEAFDQPGCRVIDVGSGAGFPGVPLKLVRPNIDLTLLESRGKRAEFLAALIPHLGISDVAVVTERAEILGRASEHREQYDVAVARALAELPVVLELCLPLVRPGGVLIAPRSGDLQAQCRVADPALAELGGTWDPIIPVELPGLTDARGLVVARKTKQTPERYPRRTGIPAKRPLAG